MDPQYGFIGIPEEREVPRMCGGCHARGGNFIPRERGSNCVSCHSSHRLRRAGIHMVSRKGVFSFSLLTTASILSFGIGFFGRVKGYCRGRRRRERSPLLKRIFIATG